MYVCTEWLSLAGLLMIVELVSPARQDEILLGPQKGLMVYTSKKGALVRMSRQLPSPEITASTLTPTPAAVTISSTATPAPTSSVTPGHLQTTGEILLYLAELREVDADGVKVKQSNGVERAFSPFKTQDFNDTQVSTSVIPNFHPSIQADILTLNLTLPWPLSGHFKILVSVTKANGSLTSGDEVMTLTEGQLDVSVEIDDWRWCDSNCSSSKPSKFIELDVVIQLSSGRTVKEVDSQSYGRPKRYSLGKDAWTDFPTKVLLDGSWQNLTSGYSKLSTSDSKNILTVRMPRFNSSAFYNMAFDPGFQPADSMGGPVGCASALGDVTVHWFAAVAMVSSGLRLFV